MTAGARNALVIPSSWNNFQNLCWVDVAHDDVGATDCQSDHRPSSASDVEHWHRGEVDTVLGEPPLVDDFDQAAEHIVVGQQDTLRQAGGPRRVKLKRDVVGPGDHAGILGGIRGDPVGELRPAVALADRDDGVHPGELFLDGFDVSEELGANDQYLGMGVLDDLQHLRRRQSPICRHAHSAEFRKSE